MPNYVLMKYMILNMGLKN